MTTKPANLTFLFRPQGGHSFYRAPDGAIWLTDNSGEDFFQVDTTKPIAVGRLRDVGGHSFTLQLREGGCTVVDSATVTALVDHKVYDVKLSVGGVVFAPAPAAINRVVLATCDAARALRRDPSLAPVLSDDVATLHAEVDVLRGTECEANGDGPCGVCIKCALAGKHVKSAPAARVSDDDLPTALYAVMGGRTTCGSPDAAIAFAGLELLGAAAQRLPGQRQADVFANLNRARVATIAAARLLRGDAPEPVDAVEVTSFAVDHGSGSQETP